MHHLFDSLREQIAAETDPAVALRRAIHRHPELGHHEYATSQAVLDHLTAAGIEAAIWRDGIGVVADVGTDGPMVAFRADLDALPVMETTGAPYASEIPGIMHACGHDAHTAIAAGLARALASVDLPGRVRFIFQPAEECVPGGAEAMVRDGLVADVEAILAFHVDPSIPTGTVGIRSGPITAAADRIRVHLTGPGGHTSRPHQTVDLIHAAARVVTDLPQLIQRRTDPRDAIVVVFGKIEGGAAENVIPTTVDVAGTIRMFDADLWRSMPPLARRLVADVLAPLGAEATVDYQRGAPPVVNDAAVISVVEKAAASVLGPEGVMPTKQSLGAEDFAWFLDEIPGALIRLGAAPQGRSVDLHSATFDLDESAIPIGMMVAAESLLSLIETRR